MNTKPRNTFGNASAMQGASGAILSKVTRDGRTSLDENCFATGLWLRELRMRNLSSFAGFEEIQIAALDFLAAASKSDQICGQVFGFWPAGKVPSWARDLGPDLDDTCVVLNELVCANRVCKQTLKPSLYRLLAQQRVPSSVVDRPSWAKAGSYYTWIGSGGENAQANVIDVCVNINVIALLANLNAKNAPGYTSACQTVDSAISWASANPNRLKAIAPYYPCPEEIKYALEHAIDCGAYELVSAYEQFCMIDSSVLSNKAGAICAGAYGQPLWHCDAIQQLRHQRFNLFGSMVGTTGAAL